MPVLVGPVVDGEKQSAGSEVVVGTWWGGYAGVCPRGIEQSQGARTCKKSNHLPRRTRSVDIAYVVAQCWTYMTKRD